MISIAVLVAILLAVGVYVISSERPADAACGIVCFLILVLGISISIWIGVRSSMLKAVDQQILHEIIAHNQRNTEVVARHIMRTNGSNSRLHMYALGHWSEVILYTTVFIAHLRWDHDSLLYLSIDEIHKVDCAVRHVGTTQTGTMSMTYAGAAAFDLEEKPTLSGKLAFTGSAAGGGVGQGHHESQSAHQFQTIIDVYTRNSDVPHWQSNFMGNEMGGKHLEATLHQGILNLRTS